MSGAETPTRCIANATEKMTVLLEFLVSAEGLELSTP